MWPQLIMLALGMMALGSDIVRHGTPRTGNHSFVTSVIAIGISWALLYWGGFFDPLLQAMKASQ